MRVELAPDPLKATSLPEVSVGLDDFHASRVRPGTDPVLFRAALQAGVLGVMANLIPFGLGMVLTGILASLLYQRGTGTNLRSWKAARLGVLAGAIAFASTSLLTVLAVVLLNSQQAFHDLMMQKLERSITNQADPGVQSFIQWIHTAEGFGIFLAFVMLGALLFSMFLAAVGSMLGTKMFRNRNRSPL